MLILMPTKDLTKSTEWWENMSREEQIDYVKLHPKTSFKDKLKAAKIGLKTISADMHKRASAALMKGVKPENIKNALQAMSVKTKNKYSLMLKKFSKIKNKGKRLKAFAFVATKIMLQAATVVVAAAVIGNMSPMSIFVPGVMASVWDRTGAVFDGTAGTLGSALGIFASKSSRNKIEPEDLQGNVYMEDIDAAHASISKDTGITTRPNTESDVVENPISVESEVENIETIKVSNNTDELIQKDVTESEEPKEGVS
jgi:hypothetical protein